MPRKATSSALPGLKVTATELARDGGIKFGNLWKAGNFRKTMHERFFVLRPSCYLFYFKKPTDTVPAGVVEVARYEAKMEKDIRDQDDGYQFPFKIQNREAPSATRVFHLEAASDEERQSWFDAFGKMQALNKLMRTGGAASEEMKVELADLKERLRDKEVALQALRDARAGSDSAATASFKAEIRTLETRLEASQAKVAEANARADKLAAELLQAQVAVSAATSAGAGGEESKSSGAGKKAVSASEVTAAVAAATKQITKQHNKTMAAKTRELDHVKQKYDTLLAAQVAALGSLHQLAGTVQVSPSDPTNVVAIVNEVQEAVDALRDAAQSNSKRRRRRGGDDDEGGSDDSGGDDSGGDDSDEEDDSDGDGEETKRHGRRRGRSSAAKPPPRAKSVAARLGGDARSGDDASNRAATGPATTTADDGNFSMLRSKSKGKVSVKELDRLPPPWFPDRHIAKCQMCGKSFGVFRRKHHCRRCGRCVCSSCAPNRCRKALPEFGYRNKVRHCVDCFDLFAIW